MTRRSTHSQRRALPLAGLLALGALPGPLPAQPAEGVAVDGSYLLQVPADRVRIALRLAAQGDSPQTALEALRVAAMPLGALLEAGGVEPASMFTADAPPAPAAAATGWMVVREIRATLPIAGSPRVLNALAAQPGVTVTEVVSELADRERIRQQAIERATAEAAGKAVIAARQLGFTVGSVREIRVEDREQTGPASIGVEAKVSVRYALVPASSRNEVLAIAAARAAAPEASPGAAPVTAATAAPSTAAAATAAGATAAAAKADAATTGPTPTGASTADDSAPVALAVEIVDASYDATGRGRFTTAVGTIWREVVPVPREQRLRSGRRYAGTITAGIFGGYRMQLTGVPRILKVEPVPTPQPAAR